MKDDSIPPIDVDAERQRSLSVAVEKALSTVITREAFTKERRSAFIGLLVAGMTVSQAARTIGFSAQYIGQLRRADPKWDEACTLALEIGSDGILERLAAIALHGNPESMATVRAAETYLKGAHPAYRQQAGGSVRLERRHADGTIDRISASANGIPD